jgi:alpha-tubulin suppressor-like RCC1 family protein
VLKVSIFLITVALIAGMVGCVQPELELGCIPVVAAGESHTVGLKDDGTVLAVGYNAFGECDVGSWMDTIQIAAGYFHTAGLKSDGTVVAVGDNRYGQCDVGGWTDVIQVAAGNSHTVGLKSDGTVVTAGGEIELAEWDLF